MQCRVAARFLSALIPVVVQLCPTTFGDDGLQSLAGQGRGHNATTPALSCACTARARRASSLLSAVASGAFETLRLSSWFELCWLVARHLLQLVAWARDRARVFRPGWTVRCARKPPHAARGTRVAARAWSGPSWARAVWSSE